MSIDHSISQVVTLSYYDTYSAEYKGEVVSVNETVLGLKYKKANGSKYYLGLFPWKRIATAWLENKSITSRSELEIGDSVAISLRAEWQENDNSIGQFFSDGDFVGTSDSDGTYFVVSDLAFIESEGFKEKTAQEQ
ncbi:MAG: hypothetical protein LBP92_12480 [Deltaproteobacteria bacterium]|jgi:hypothetical protein|nr:hypothetical protein [Deltaproteobacteria bacterium]